MTRVVAGVTEEEFLYNEMLRYAVAQRLTIVGEASSRVTAEQKLRTPHIPWADIVAFRNIIVHEYFGIYWPLVWQTAVDHAPALRAQVAALLALES